MAEQKTYQQPSEQGYYGEYGGAFIPEMLYGNVEELRTRYREIMDDPSFRKELDSPAAGIMPAGPHPYILQNG